MGGGIYNRAFDFISNSLHTGLKRNTIWCLNRSSVDSCNSCRCMATGAITVVGLTGSTTVTRLGGTNRITRDNICIPVSERYTRPGDEVNTVVASAAGQLAGLIHPVITIRGYASGNG